ncbi:MAG: hypothetical protein ACREO2_07255, partial [Arenimonas sp.]
MLLDPKTALLIVALLVLLNGMILAYMRTDLPLDLRTSIRSWQQGTFLQAVAYLCFASQEFFSIVFAMPLANSLLYVGMTCYWRALRQFNHQRDRWRLILPMALGAVLIFWFSFVFPSRILRVASGSLIMAIITGACAWDIARYRRIPPPRSARLLIGIFAATALFMVWRCIYSFNGVSEVDSALVPSGLRTATSLVLLAFQGMTTTGFLLLCT